MKGEHLFVALCVLVVGGGTLIHLVLPKPPLAHAVITVDGSTSVEPNCVGVRDASKSLQKKPGVREGSLLSVLVMGTSESDINPKLAFSGRVPFLQDLVYGQDPVAFQKEQDQFFAQVAAACQSAKTGRSSPIYELVTQGIAHLRSESMGCGPDGKCYLLVKTDLEEDVHPGLRGALARAAKDPDAILPADLRGSIDNAGIEVMFCGVSEGRALREKPAASAPLEARKKIWTDLFTDSDLVSFQPYCSR